MLRGVGFGWSGVVEEDEGGYEWRAEVRAFQRGVASRETEREQEEEERGDAARRKGKRGR